MAKARASRRSKPASRHVSRRAQTVWGSLLGAMTLVVGGLLALDRSRAPSTEGMTLPPLVATSTPDSVDVIFRTTSPLDARRWKAIVIHDTGSPSGSPDALDAAARKAGLRSLGQHFVIGNGKGMADGELHVGGRWMSQSLGAHTAGPNSDWYNRNAIGICLVGDGDRKTFSPAQMRRLVQLVDALCQELGIPADQVFLHSQLAQTTSPGRLFPDAAFRAQLAGSR